MSHTELLNIVSPGSESLVLEALRNEPNWSPRVESYAVDGLEAASTGAATPSNMPTAHFSNMPTAHFSNMPTVYFSNMPAAEFANMPADVGTE